VWCVEENSHYYVNVYCSYQDYFCFSINLTGCCWCCCCYCCCCCGCCVCWNDRIFSVKIEWNKKKILNKPILMKWHKFWFKFSALIKCIFIFYSIFITLALVQCTETSFFLCVVIYFTGVGANLHLMQSFWAFSPGLPKNKNEKVQFNIIPKKLQSFIKTIWW
jgi:hypothetical protein